MKIALIGLRLTIGPRLIADTLGDAFQQRGHDVVFIGERNYRPPASIRGIGVSDGSSYRTMMRDTLSRAFYRRAVAAVLREAPDVCYFCSAHPANGPLALAIREAVARAQAGPPPLIALHVHDPLPHPGAASLPIFVAQQVAVRCADLVAVYGRALADQMTRYYRVEPRRIVQILHGASRPLRELAPPAPDRYRWFSFLGRIERYKGLGIFLRAARGLAARHPSVRFYVGGQGDITGYRDDLAALGERVTVVNRELSNDETDRVMQESFGVVLPYTSATQSGVIPVAYWNGCPVIATSVGALAETVEEGETGFVVAPGDVEAVAARMAELVEPGRREAMGRAAFDLYQSRFRWDHIADELVTGFGGTPAPRDRAPMLLEPEPAGQAEGGRA